MLMKEVFIIALGYCNEIGTKIMKEKRHYFMYIV